MGLASVNYGCSCLPGVCVCGRGVCVYGGGVYVRRVVCVWRRGVRCGSVRVVEVCVCGGGVCVGGMEVCVYGGGVCVCVCVRVCAPCVTVH